MTDDAQRAWYGPETATLGDRITGAREAAGLTQEQLARRLGVRASTVRAWEEDRSEPRANSLSTLAGVLNVSIMWLLVGEGEGASDPGNETSLSDNAGGILTELRILKEELASASQKTIRVEQMLQRLLGKAG